MELSEDDVLHILKLIDESKFDYFQLEVGELKITVSKGDPIPSAAEFRATRGDKRDSGGRAKARRCTRCRRRRRPKPRRFPQASCGHGADPRNFLCGAGARRAAICDRRPASH